MDGSDSVYGQTSAEYLWKKKLVRKRKEREEGKKVGEEGN